MTDTAKVIQIADAVVAALNAETFVPPFVATREYVPAIELSDLETLRVAVVPKGLAAEPASRTTAATTYQVDIGVLKKLPTAADELKAEADALMLLVQNIVEFLNRRKPTATGVVWVSTENDPIFLPEHIDEFRQFTSVITVSYHANG